MCDSQEVLAALWAWMHDNDGNDKRDHGCVEGKWNMKNKTNRQRGVGVWGELMAPALQRGDNMSAGTVTQNVFLTILCGCQYVRERARLRAFIKTQDDITKQGAVRPNPVLT